MTASYDRGFTDFNLYAQFRALLLVPSHLNQLSLTSSLFASDAERLPAV